MTSASATTSNALAAKAPKIAKALLIALLLVWLCYSLARIFWSLLPPPLEYANTVAATPASSSTVDTNVPSVDIAKLKRAALFGEPPAVAPINTAAEDSEDAVETQLNLSLSGVFTNEDQSNAYAIIVSGNDQSLYRVNDEIESNRNVSLTKVLDDRVILDNNGRSESLLLYPEGEAIIKEGAPVYQEPVANNTPRTKAPTAVRSLSEVIKVSMAREGGQVVGFRVRPGRNRAAFDSLGLKANDIVTEVNGVSLTSSAKAMEVYRSMSTATDASLKIKRKDEQLSVEVSLAALQSQ